MEMCCLTCGTRVSRERSTSSSLQPVTSPFKSCSSRKFTVTRSSGSIHGRMACNFSSLVIPDSFPCPRIPTEYDGAMRPLFVQACQWRIRLKPAVTVQCHEGREIGMVGNSNLPRPQCRRTIGGENGTGDSFGDVL